MTQRMTGVLVLIASPGDAAEERGVVQNEINDWNVRSGRRASVALLPWLWERHAIPTMGGRPQALVNRQAVDRADVVVAFFDSRLGTSTGVDVSGTAEEIKRAVELGKPVHVYFSNEPLPRDVDGEQLAALRAFKGHLSTEGLLGEYSDPADLAGQVVHALEADIDEQRWATAPPDSSTSRAARLRWRHDHAKQDKGLDRRGKVIYRTVKNDLVVRNDGTVPAEDLIFEVSPVGSTDFHFDSPAEPLTVHPESELSWLLISAASFDNSDRNVQVSARWREAGAERTGTWSVTLQG